MDSPSIAAEPIKSVSDQQLEKKLDTISTSVQYTTAAYQSQQAAKKLGSSNTIKLREEKLANSSSNVIPPYGSSLHSDRMLSSGSVQPSEKSVVCKNEITGLRLLLSVIVSDNGGVHHLNLRSKDEEEGVFDVMLKSFFLSFG